MKTDKIRISFNISPDLNTRLRTAAELQDISITAFIKLAVEKFLNDLEKK